MLWEHVYVSCLSSTPAWHALIMPMYWLFNGQCFLFFLSCLFIASRREVFAKRKYKNKGIAFVLVFLVIVFIPVVKSLSICGEKSFALGSMRAFTKSGFGDREKCCGGKKKNNVYVSSELLLLLLCIDGEDV